MSHVLETENVWRKDISGELKDSNPLLSNAPVRDKNYYKVPKIIEG